MRSTHLTKRCTVGKSFIQTFIILTRRLSETRSASHTHSFCLFSLVLTTQMANIECFRAHSTHCMGAGHTGQQQARLHNKGKSSCQSELLGSTTACTRTDWATSYGCVHSGACYISSIQKFTFRPGMYHTSDSRMSAAHSAYNSHHLGQSCNVCPLSYYNYLNISVMYVNNLWSWCVGISHFFCTFILQ